MPVALVGSKVVPTGNPTTGGTMVIPSAVLTGDWLEVVFTSRDHTSGTALPAVTDNDTGGNTWTVSALSADRKHLRAVKRATSGSASKTVTVAGCVGSFSAVLSAWSGTDESADPTENLATETNASGDESHAGITPASADAMLRFAITNYANDNAVTTLASANHGAMTMTEKLSTGGSDCATADGHDLIAGQGATGSITWAQTNGTTYSTVWTLKPASIPPVSGSGGVDLDAPSVASTGKETFLGSGGVDLDAPAVASSGKETMLGTGGVDIDAPAVSGSGTHTESGVTGTGAVDLDAPAVAGTGSELLTGTGALDLDVPAVAGSGLEQLIGSGAITLLAPAVSGDGEVLAPVTGIGAITILAPAMSGIGIGGTATVTSGGFQSRRPPKFRGTAHILVAGRGKTSVQGPQVSGTGQVNDDELVLRMLQ